MRKFLTVLSILVAVAVLNSLALVPSAHAKSKTIVLKAAAMAPRDMPVMKGFEEWGKEIEKLTNGKVKFEFYWGASLLKSADALKGTGMGLADVCIDVPAYHPADTPFGTIGELGFITSQVDAPARALSDLYESVPNFRNQFDRHNLKIMFFVPFTPTILGLSNNQVKTLGDLKGKKIRALGLLNQVIAKLGERL